MILRRWALCEVQHIPDISDPSRTYLTRLRIVETPWCGLFLHRILLPDADRHLHDHPWTFVSLILRGGYTEWIKASAAAKTTRWKTRRAGRVHVTPLSRFHAIRRLHRTPTWTLVFVGRRQRDWGYLTPSGWVSHLDYHQARGAA